ncbi:unnamed protein product [Prorocentrum cordatum]|uniref:Protein transport protein SEC13 n=1 Tax=Prorocentrum cordatum TaxID=2364126 RepID=A0ABN9QAH7_9DINO|nr:unnamed protein product [Polarella glacialis]
MQGPLTALEFCGAESGLSILAAGAGDELGILTVLARQFTSITASTVQPKSDQWQSHPLPAHDGGIVALSWAPVSSPATLATGPAIGRAAPIQRRLVTAGVDGSICVWRCQGKLDSWERQHELADERHVGNVTDVAWRPNLGLPTSVVATCTDEGMVATWVQELGGHPWRLRSCWQVPGDARRLCWSAGGLLLCVSVGETSCLMFKEVVGGQWEQLEPVER